MYTVLILSIYIGMLIRQLPLMQFDFLTAVFSDPVSAEHGASGM